ncbi:membrane protein [Mycobacterium marinum]|uniref:DUF4407 domain-containing protein n=1 Tax=Mycobacterium marinum TaxID=1781 RepID=UPI000358C149|nr:DUF4407 domain-containing protein [Mycobacterium marinum]AXN49971.1 hypothetical protein CCUG20998_02566 [Mycobacterium marinum]EPQ80305.1 hypothetical protein MMEU_0830 [Mycobacterium marinum str. Europe]RFZ22762.1 hypothetical protein DSM43519_03013 [Mycobacterium marinum]RFZ24943.1 hypothetical protein DSM44344_02717 [Mycobacterium marinum]WOR06969.1 DUF4407 domain-containing protein [Mycobacterium marinum]
MCAQKYPEQRSTTSRIEGLLTWLGGGHWRELGERHERSTHAVAGAVVAFGAVLAWLVAGLAVRESTSWPGWAVVGVTLVFGLLIGAVTRGTASALTRRWPSIVGRAAVAVAVGVVVGELAALVAFSGSIERYLDEHALRNAQTAPAVAAASQSLRQSRTARRSLDNAVEEARVHLDSALVVARCEYHPTADCPQTRITGIPGRGPETRTANQLLADSQRELDNALAARDRQASDLDAKVARDEQALAEAQRAVVANAGGGLGTHWVAMNALTFASKGALALRLLTIAFFALVYLLPLILWLWRGETTHDRHAAARAQRDRAELDADTAIAVKRAEVRQAAEIMWAEHQLNQTRMAIEAQAEIDREQQRRRVIEALELPVRASSQRTDEPVEEDMYLPIAAEAEAAASRAVAELPAGAAKANTDTTRHLPAQVESSPTVERHEQDRAAPLIPSIPDATKAAARWIRPLVPPFVARVIDNTTQPIRSARQVFEEVEEIAFSFKRTRKVTVNTESSDDHREQPAPQSAGADAPAPVNRIASSRGDTESGSWAEAGEGLETHVGQPSLGQVPAADAVGLPVGTTKQHGRRELAEREGPRELRSPDGPRQLPPGK